jgi:hypothetical protein
MVTLSAKVGPAERVGGRMRSASGPWPTRNESSEGEGAKSKARRALRARLGECESLLCVLQPTATP